DRLLPIEVKWTAAPNARSLRGLHAFLDDFRPRAPFGVVLYRGRETIAISPRVLLVPFATFFGAA
ncbi:MAG: hypothetical protein HYR51_06665, partial [Candidatus Rokubacteria bacterium]|nr:hypothetical protein [Candidatus Rokubacteria bacterium]